MYGALFCVGHTSQPSLTAPNADPGRPSADWRIGALAWAVAAVSCSGVGAENRRRTQWPADYRMTIVYAPATTPSAAAAPIANRVIDTVSLLAF